MKNQIFIRDTMETIPWKNGGGITREIAASQDGQPYWRLSIADVKEDAVFSKFENLQRILTIIKGNGMVLCKADHNLIAPPYTPVHFNGGDRVFGKLTNGAIQDFNLIYDASKLDGCVEVGLAARLLENRLASDDPSRVVECIYCIEGRLKGDDFGLLADHHGVVNPTRAIDVLDPESTLVLKLTLTLKED